MKKIILLLLISGSAWAQQPTMNKNNFEDFILIEKVEDQEKFYNEMLKQLPAGKKTPAATNDYRGELAYGWLAKGNVERYNYYKATAPKFNPRQFLYLCYTLENMFDSRKQYTAVEKITREILDEFDKGTMKDPIGRSEILVELNAAANARLGNNAAAGKMMARLNGKKSETRDMKYFKDSKSNYYNRYAIVMTAAGQHQTAFDTLTKAFREADSNPYMISTFREVYKKVKGTEKGFDQYIKGLQKEAYAKCYKEVEALYLSKDSTTLEGTLVPVGGNGKPMTLFQAKKPVKEISLLDLDGKTVNLGDYQGKILVVDFWTTLCTPCVAAFSGFEKVVSDYNKDAFQLFVINLFEDQPTVRSYVAKKGITLDVLRDEENAAYDVQGTPTKIVFDPIGNIRFYSAGYAGSTDREYYKLKAMVEITKARAAASTTALNK
ncbi:TlpA family protein disulfide reductase [Pseudoflavitalea rhizosphaerae]|uniref:TlpA family protein disulfide reductase n=1 Tax=Pseudoflavitalea rhizosphaerae TaxID=1884793 RepID=UPI000F8EEAC5|nr:TlpA disulfide reductase family protein [Pseudoflavitalea rhizosphaerae]